MDICGTVAPLAGGRYWGVPVSSTSLKRALELWRLHVGPQEAEELSKAQSSRDRGAFHLTVLTPGETARLPVEAARSLDGLQADIAFRGIGHATGKGGREAWFVVAGSDGLAQARARLGLHPKDFHVTIGFRRGDVHGVRKDLKTVVIPL